jgi:hypothetical protein
MEDNDRLGATFSRFPEETRILWAQFASLRIEDNILYHPYYRADDS